jgi:hypothetical protein
LADVCECLEDFHDSLNEDFYFANFASSIEEKRNNEAPIAFGATSHQRIKLGTDVGRPRTVKQAVLDIMKKSPNTDFDVKAIRTIIKRRYKGAVSYRTNTIILLGEVYYI